MGLTEKLHGLATVKTVTSKRYYLSLSGGQLVELLGLPDDCAVSVKVPAGDCDWGEESLIMDSNNRLVLSWMATDE